MRIVENIIVASISAALTALIFWITARAGGMIREVFIPELPGDAVVAFNGPCPDEWTPFEEGAGKFLLGAGTGTLRYQGPHRPAGAKAFETLTPVEVGDQGGEEMHMLTISEMPSHSHFQVWGQSAGSDKAAASGNNLANYRGSTMVQTTRAAGGGIAHNNVPPYVSLSFCKKSAKH